MKNFKKIASAIAALSLAACVAVPMSATVFTASAAKVTVQNGEESTVAKSTFSAYKILDVKFNEDKDAYSYTVVEQFREILKTATGKDTDSEIIAHLGTLAGSEDGLGDDTLRPVADAIYKAIKSNGSIEADATSTDGVFNDLEQGYYIIAETSLGDGEKTYSLVMVDTVENVETTVTVKKDAPTFEKKIKDTNDSGTETGDDHTGNINEWRDSADHDFNDVVDFQLTATLPADYDKYETYKLVFHDGLQDDVFTYVDGSAKIGVNEASGDAATYKKASTCEDSFTKGGTCEMEFTIDDVKKSFPTAKAGDKIVIEYQAKLTENAVIGEQGNWNSDKLEYSNNVYASGEEDTDNTGETPEDDVVTFTYEFDVNKVDQDNDPLEGAHFTLFKDDGTGTYSEEVKEITDVTSKFEFKGLDAGKYKLVESLVPDGYTKAEDIEFEIKAKHNDGETPQLLSLTVDKDTITADKASGILDVTVKNQGGAKLPSTGGIGTTLFYLGGGALVAVAGVMLITKKRMTKE